MTSEICVYTAVGNGLSPVRPKQLSKVTNAAYHHLGPKEQISMKFLIYP